MDPMLYRKKRRAMMITCLLLLGLCARLLCAPNARSAVWKRVKAVLGSESLLRAVVFWETGIRLERKDAAADAVAAAAAYGEPRETGAEEVAAPEAAVPTAAAESAAATEPEASAKPAAEAEPSEEATPATEAAPEAEAISFFPEEAEAIHFRGDCSYEVDKAELLLRPLEWSDEPGPKVLIIHTHSCEAYTESEGHAYLPSANYRTLDMNNNVVAVGDALAEELARRGVELIHDRTYNDYPDYNSSYAVARSKIKAYLEQYPSIVMVLDLHRDALEQPVRETVELDGQTVAPLMLVIGTNEGGLEHPHWADNLSCGLKLQALANRETPELFKRISFRQSRFNGDLTRGSLIVEVGSTENTLPEAVAAMPYLAEYVAELLECP